MLKNCEDENNVQYYENTYNCTFCDYITNKKSNYDRHLLSSKHKNNSNGLTIKQYNCEQCNKIFITRSALWKHNNKYHNHNNENKNDIAKLTNIVYKLADTISDLAKNVGNNNNNTTTNNNHNRFNINVYLNETCSNAMNINEFVDSIQVGIEDLEETSRLGFVDGISRIIINNLNKIDRPDRPIHCSDSKRMTFYIKNEDTWNKNDNNNDKLKFMIQNIAGKNMKQIYEWQKLNPEYCDPSSKSSDTYQKMLFQVMNGDTIEESNENINKIIKNIAKETIIFKKNFENFCIK
jgi:hypothetical protein